MPFDPSAGCRPDGPSDPIVALSAWLAHDGKPPLWWVVQFGADGGDPLAGAWAAFPERPDTGNDLWWIAQLFARFAPRRQRAINDRLAAALGWRIRFGVLARPPYGQPWLRRVDHTRGRVTALDTHYQLAYMVRRMGLPMPPLADVLAGPRRKTVRRAG